MIDRNEMLRNLLNASDEEYGMYLFLFELLTDKIKNDDKIDMIKSAIKCGIDEANSLLTQFPDLSLESIVEKFGLSVDIRNEYADSYGRYLFGFYEYPNKIHVVLKSCDYVLENLETYDPEFKEIITKEKIIKLILAHELFHYIENKHRKTIYTKTKKVVTFNFFGLKLKSNVTALSEIAAMSFAKAIIGVSFNPVILDYLLLDYKETKDAYKIYSAICKEEVNLHANDNL